MTQLFPSLPGLAWPVVKRPVWSTRVASHVSGREVRAAEYTYPLYEFELSFEFLRATELTTLMGFYQQCQGGLLPFRYVDPSDDVVTGQVLGVGDGSTTSFLGLRNLGGWIEPVGFVENVSHVYANGAAASGWSLSAPNIVTFAAAPASGVQISADFGFSFLCRFTDDKIDFENFLSGLWSAKSLKFRSVR